MRELFRIAFVGRGLWGWMLVGIVASSAVIAANSLLMAISGWFIASMAVAGVAKSSFNYFVPSAAIRLFAIGRTVGRYLERLLTHGAALRLLSQLRVWLFLKFAPLSPGVLEKYSGGELSARFRGDIDSLESLYIRIIAPLSTGLLTICAATVFVAVWCASAAAALLVFLVISGVILPLAAQRLAEVHARASTRLSGDLRRVVTDGLEGGDELLLLDAMELHCQRVEKISADLISEQNGQAVKVALMSAANVLAAGAGVTAVLLLSSRAVISGGLPGPDLVMLLLFAAAAFESAGGMAAAMMHYPAAAESARRILEIAEAANPVGEPSEAAAVPAEFSIYGTKVQFSYGNNVVLRDFDLDLPFGSRVALIGRSGSGKSSLVEILLRFREYSGSIVLGGRELREYGADELRRSIAALPQEPHIFNTTIRENIILSNPEASAEEIAGVVHTAVLDEWLERLPDGLETRTGEGGREISGGEARRIALARTLLKDVPLYILDEPTEGLDSATEAKLLERLDRRLQGRSLLLITHRPEPLGIVDRIVRLD